MRASRDRLEAALARIADPSGEGARACLTVYAESARVAAWEAYQAPIKAELDRASGLIARAQQESPDVRLADVVAELADPLEISRRVVQSAARRAAYALRGREGAAAGALRGFVKDYAARNDERYLSFLYSASPESPLKVTPIAALEQLAAQRKKNGNASAAARTWRLPIAARIRCKVAPLIS